MPALMIVLVLILIGLLAYGHSRLSTAFDRYAADGALAMVLATILGVLLVTSLVIEVA